MVYCLLANLHDNPCNGNAEIFRPQLSDIETQRLYNIDGNVYTNGIARTVLHYSFSTDSEAITGRTRTANARWSVEPPRLKKSVGIIEGAMLGRDIVLTLPRAVLNAARARDNQIGGEPDEQTMLDDARARIQSSRQLSRLGDGPKMTIQNHIA